MTATDVRPATKEQVESLGAKFVAVEDDEFKQAETAGGYAKEMSKEYQAKQAALVASHIAKQDIVITTALIPGRPAPKLITKAMVESMRAGSVIVDLAVERGGNCELAEPGKIAVHNGVKIVGHLNVPGRLAATSSALYARNLVSFLDVLIKDKQFNVPWDDEIVKATLLTKDGAVVHPNSNRREPRDGRDGGGRSVRVPAVDFVLAVFVGYYVVWSVTSALHTPLMSVTNAISSVIVVGALLAVGVSVAGDETATWWARGLGFAALVLASVNIFGGFLVTQRMLAMYQKKKK